MCRNMVRTKADNSARKAVAAKAPRKALAPTRSAGAMMSPSSGGKKDRYSGGNPVNPQPTPEWQKSISSFFTVISTSKSSSSEKENADPSCGPSSSKDRTEEMAGGSSSPPDQDEQMEEVEQREESEREESEQESEEEQEEKPEPSKKFKRNKCISDSEDDDE